MSWLGAVLLVAALTAPVQAVGCAGQDVPPAVATEATVTPLPWPAEPVGGAGLGTCGDVGPAGVPAVGAASYVLADLDSGAVLAARAAHARHRPASTLKVLTALVVARRLNPDTVVDGTAEDLRVDGSKAGIGPDGHYTVAQLLDGLLLNSGNDAAEALARALGGDAATTAAMTETARGIGALDTRPATVSGLDGPGMAMSAYDLAVIYRVAMREKLFASTMATRMVAFPGYGPKPGFMLSSNELFVANYPGAVNSKSGFTDDARHTLVASAERGGRRLVVTLMRGEQAPVPMWRQAGALLDWGFTQPAGGPAIGTLVDTAPVPPPTVAPVAAPLPPAPQTAADPVLIGAAGAAVAVLLAVAATFLLRRRRR
ncbi:D-alanyl-D-alanine carboxypeptidase family protein [Pseudonocardia sp. GCM10023141]|uniref:D-alanyl-D-alanine carboxypeptidase family protein n=1 Tax=Pseudonocardia sp. GCM10023141 TaxID=3252653 RepID=UPI00360DA485